MAKVADEDLRASAPRFTEEHARYLELALLLGSEVTIFQPASLDSAVATLGVIGRRRGRQDVIEHIRSLLNEDTGPQTKVLS